MSITTNIVPATYSSVQDDLWHIATSNNSGQVNMKYVFDLYTQDGTRQLIRTKVYPDINNGKGYFNAGDIIKNEMTYDWFAIDMADEIYPMAPNVSGQIAITYQYRIGEDYSGVTSLNLVSGFVKAYNYLPTIWDRRNTALYSNKQLMVSRNANPYVIRSNGDDDLLIPLRFISGTSSTIVVKVYSQGNTFTTDTITGLIPYTLVGGEAYANVNIGPRVLNQHLNIGFITTNTKYYDVTFSGIPATIRVYVSCGGLYEQSQLHFINSYGMFETANFEGISKLNMSIQRKGFEKNPLVYGDSSVDYIKSNVKFYESKVNFDSVINWNMKLTYVNPTDDEYEWLSELIYSPQIYYQYNQKCYPVTIKNTNYEYSQVQNVKRKPLEIEIELNQKRNGFRR